MKRRLSHVSNSSSSSFVLAFPHGDAGEAKIQSIIEDAKKIGSLEDSRSLHPRWLDSHGENFCVDTVKFLHENGYQCVEFTVDNHDSNAMDFFMFNCAIYDYYRIKQNLK